MKNKIMRINFKSIDIKTILIVVLAGWLFASLLTCNSTEIKLNKQISEMNIENQKSKEIINGLRQIITVQETIITDNKYSIKLYTDSIFNLTKKQDKKIKDVIAYYSSKTNIIIKDSLIPYIDTNYQKKWEDSVSLACSRVIDYYEANTTLVPKKAKDSTKNYTIDLTVTQRGVEIDSIKIPNKLDVRFVTLKGGLLKRNQQGKLKLWLNKSVQVQVVNSNELLKIYNQNSIIYVPPKKGRFLEKAILIGAGIFLGTKL